MMEEGGLNLQLAILVFAGVAFASWLTALIAAIMMMQHRLPGRSVWWYCVNGWAFFVGGTFAPGAYPAQRVFIIAAVLFILVILVLFGFSAIKAFSFGR